MAGYPRDKLEDVVHRWLQANRTAERRGDWTLLADFYTDDATYGWNVGPNEDVMCVGIDEIRDIALGQEMDGLQGWRYPYQRVVIDEKQGEVVGFWKQVATDANGAEQEVYGIGGSWFRYARRREMELATRFLRLRSCFRALPGIDQGRQAIARHAEAHRTRRVGQQSAGLLPARQDAGATVVNALAPLTYTQPVGVPAEARDHS